MSLLDEVIGDSVNTTSGYVSGETYAPDLVDPYLLPQSTTGSYTGSVQENASGSFSGTPAWVIPPEWGSINTQALVELTNPATGEVWTAPSGGYSINPDVTTQTPQESGSQEPVATETRAAETTEGNRFALQYPDQSQNLVDPTVAAAVDILNRAPSVGPAQIALDADREYLEGTGASGLYTAVPTSTGDSTTAVYGADWRNRLAGTENQPSGTTTTVVDESGGGDSWDDVTYSDFTGDITTGFTDAISTLGDSIMDSINGLGLGDLVTDIGESITGTLSDFGLDAVSDTLSDLGVSIGDMATDLGEGFVQIGDSIVDTVTGAVTDLSGELVGVVSGIEGIASDVTTGIGDLVTDISESITGTLSDFGLDAVSDTLSDLGVSIGDMATDLGEGFVQIGDSIVDTVTGAVTDLSGELVGVVDDIGEDISGAVTDLGEGFVQIGDSIVDTVTGAVTDVGTTLGEGIEGAVSGIEGIASDVTAGVGDLIGDLGATVTTGFEGIGEGINTLGTDIGEGINTLGTDLGAGFVQIGDSIVDTVTGAVTDLSGELVGVVDDIGEDISGAVTDIGTNIGSAVDAIEETISPVTDALSPISDAIGEVRESIDGVVGSVEEVVGDALTSVLPDDQEDPQGVGPQYQGEYGAILSVIDNMVDGMTFAEAMDALYSDPDTGLESGEIGSPYGWDWGSFLDPAYGALSFTTPFDVVDSEGSPATNDPGGTVTDSAGNPVGVETGGTLGYGDLNSAADAYGTDPGSEQTQMLTEQDAGFGYNPSDPDDFSVGSGWGGDSGFGTTESGDVDVGSAYGEGWGGFDDDSDGFGGWGDDGMGGFGDAADAGADGFGE